jgi:hypothetical protein
MASTPTHGNAATKKRKIKKLPDEQWYLSVD